MKIEIKNIYGSVLFEGDFSSLIEAVKSAVSKKVDLGGADLGGADLGGADLRGAELKDGEIIKKIERPFFMVGPIGSGARHLMAFSTYKGIRLKTGCFFGSIEKFEEQLKETHGDNSHAKEYVAALVLIKTHFEIWDK